MNKPNFDIMSDSTSLILREMDIIRQGVCIDRMIKIGSHVECGLRKELILQTSWYMQKEIERIGIDTYIKLIKEYDLNICAVLSNHSLRTDLLDEECPYDGSDYDPKGENFILCALEYLVETGFITKQHLAKIKMYSKEL